MKIEVVDVHLVLYIVDVSDIFWYKGIIYYGEK